MRARVFAPEGETPPRMLIILKQGSSADDLATVEQIALGLGLESHRVELPQGSAIALTGKPDAWQITRSVDFHRVPAVAHVVPLRDRPARAVGSGASGVTVGSHEIGRGRLTVIAGPCAVEDERQLLSLARAMKLGGADLLRGGAYKPRTSPYSFQGLGEQGLRMLVRAREETGLPVVTEAVDEESLALVCDHADAVQIGARNMQNFQLLRRAGRCGKPVLLKRGMSATLEELLLAAEYILDAGNPDVMLCERGIRGFSDHARYTIDLSIVPALQRLSPLPVFVDPSHATGSAELVGPMARAAVAAGADGVMLEVHPDPAHALCDGPQALLPEAFARLCGELRVLSTQAAAGLETVS